MSIQACFKSTVTYRSTLIWEEHKLKHISSSPGFWLSKVHEVLGVERLWHCDDTAEKKGREREQQNQTNSPYLLIHNLLNCCCETSVAERKEGYCKHLLLQSSTEWGCCRPVTNNLNLCGLSKPSATLHKHLLSVARKESDEKLPIDPPHC